MHAVIAYGVSALSPSMDVANTAVPALLSLLLFLSGSCVRVAQIPVYLRWVAHINVLRYAFGGLMINQFSGQKGKAYFGASVVGHPGVVAAANSVDTVKALIYGRVCPPPTMCWHKVLQ
jgi:ATP-binding cassette, subfamily G (WHITE), member 2